MRKTNRLRLLCALLAVIFLAVGCRHNRREQGYVVYPQSMAYQQSLEQTYYPQSVPNQQIYQYQQPQIVQQYYQPPQQYYYQQPYSYQYYQAPVVYGGFGGYGGARYCYPPTSSYNPRDFEGHGSYYAPQRPNPVSNYNPRAFEGHGSYSVPQRPNPVSSYNPRNFEGPCRR